MRWLHGLLSLLFLSLSTCPASAQRFIVVNPYLGSASFNYARPSRYGYFSLSSAGYGYGSYGYGYIGYPRSSSTSLNIVTISPPTSVVIVPRSSLGLDDDRPRDTATRRERAPEPAAPAPPAEKPLPGLDAGEFRPLAPDNRKQAEQPIPPAPPPAKKVAEEPPLPPRLPQPEADPVAENARLIKAGKAAFVGQEYGRAAQRFRQASVVVANDFLSHFLLAQSLFALGKYQEAIKAIDAGMALRPDWPLQRFSVRELYGDNAAAYPEQLRRLEDTLSRFPNDPVLLFLLAYQLWFDGHKDEVRPLLLRARPGAADKAVIDRFLSPAGL